MIDIIVANGGDLSAENENKLTPFMEALAIDNIEILPKFTQKITLSAQPKLLHMITKNVLDVRYQDILIDLL